MALTRLLLGLWATAHGFLGPVAAPRRAAPLHVIETDSDTEKEIFSWGMDTTIWWSPGLESGDSRSIVPSKRYGPSAHPGTP